MKDLTRIVLLATTCAASDCYAAPVQQAPAVAAPYSHTIPYTPLPQLPVQGNLYAIIPPGIRLPGRR